jgi:hypothetical protein
MSEIDLALSRTGFVGLKIARPRPMGKKSGTLGIIPIESRLMNPDTKRNDRGEYNRVTWSFEDGSFDCQEDGIEVPVDRSAAAAFVDFFDALLESSEVSRDIVLRKLEITIATKLMDIAQIANANAGVKWTDTTGSNPISDINTGKKAIRNQRGVVPNCMCVPYENFLLLQENSKVLDRIHSYGAGQSIKSADISADVLARVFDVDYFYIADGMYNTKSRNKTAVLADIWDKTKVLLCRIPPEGDERATTPCLARTLHWDEAGGDIGGQVEVYQSPQTNGEVTRSIMFTDVKYMDLSLGYIIKEVV